MPYDVATTPSYGAQTHTVTTPNHDNASTPTGVKNNPPTQPSSPLDKRPLLHVGQAAVFKSEISSFVESIKLTVVAKFKELVGLGSATADVQRAANNLDRAVANAQRALRDDGDSMAQSSAREFQGIVDNVVEEATTFAAKLQTWLGKHERNGAPVGTDRETVQHYRDALKKTTELVQDLTSTALESVIKDKFLSKSLPPDFPINDVPRLKAMMLEHAAIQAVKAAKTPDSFLRGAEVAAYVSVMKSSVVEHFSPQIDAAREKNTTQALSEVKNDPSLLGLTAKKLLENKSVRHEVASEYQALITSMLGNSTLSAQQAALGLPEGAIEMTRRLKQALDQAVVDGKLTAREAADATRLLVVNNFFLRSINPAFIADYGHADQALNTHLMNRGNGLSIILQQHANGLDFGSKQPALAELDQKLATEKAIVNAFIDAVVARL